MTDEEFAKLEKTIEEVDKWWNSLSEEEKNKEGKKYSRFWEDWTDCDPVANPNPQPSKSRKGQK